MFDESPIIFGLEIGTSKVCAAVCEIAADGTPNIIGLGQAKSRGVRKGEIVDINLAVEDIRSALADAEESSGQEARSVFLSVTGSHVRGFNNKGTHPIASADRVITSEDVQDVIRNAKAINLTSDDRVLHIIRQSFQVDGKGGINDPVGMNGSKLHVDVHVIYGNYNRLQQSIQAVKMVQIEVMEVVFAGLASSLALLTNQQKDLGTLVIDLGGGCTEYVVYSGGIIRHTGVLSVGGDHVSNDLACGLKVPLGCAEEMKVRHGAAYVDDADRTREILIPSRNGLEPRPVSQETLRRIMTLRLEEIFALICGELEDAQVLHLIRDGVVLTGGGSKISGIKKLASQVFDLPVSDGRVDSFSGAESALEKPELSAVLGVTRFGAMEWKKARKPGQPGLVGIKNRVASLFGIRS